MTSRTWLAAMALLLACLPAQADLIFPSLTQRSGPYAVSGVPFADGYADYFTLLNERDGGINGIRIQSPECETGNNTGRGVECYEGTRGLAPLLYQPLSTAIAARIIPMAAADGIPVHAMGYGQGFLVDGRTFPGVFTYPATFWDAASVIIEHLLEQSGGSLAGRHIALVHLDSSFGREPIRMLQVLAIKHGFRLSLHPIAHPGQEQKAVWAQIAEDRPGHVLLWGWGIMNGLAIREAFAAGFPVDRLIGIWTSASETDLVAAGAAAGGYRTVALHGSGDGYPLLDEMRKHVVQAGKAAGDGSSVGQSLYYHGMFAALLAAEAARTAMDLHDTREIDAAMMREGMENLLLDEERLARLGLPGFAAGLEVNCADHGGPGVAFIQQWDAAAGQWRRISPFIEPDRELIAALVRVEATVYALENNLPRRECPQ